MGMGRIFDISRKTSTSSIAISGIGVIMTFEKLVILGIRIIIDILMASRFGADINDKIEKFEKNSDLFLESR